MSETGVWSPVLRACFAFFVVVSIASVVAASGCASDGSCSCCGCCGSGAAPATPPLEPLEPLEARHRDEVAPAGCTADERARVDRAKEDAAVAADVTDAVVAVDAALGKVQCAALRDELVAVKRDLIARAPTTTPTPMAPPPPPSTPAQLCRAVPAGWRARSDVAELLQRAAAADDDVAARVSDVVNARVVTRWPAPVGDSAVVAASIERGLRARLGWVRPAGSRWQIEHVLERCVQVKQSNDSVLGDKMHSYTCLGRAEVTNDDGALFATAPVSVQLMGISEAKAIEANLLGTSTKAEGLATALANELTLRLVEDAERRLCGR